MTTVVRIGVAPLVLPPCGQVMSSSSALPPNRRPTMLTGVTAPQHCLTCRAGEAELAHALEASGAVEASAGIEAWMTGAVIQVNGAETSSEAGGAKAREAVDSIHTGGTVGARLHQTVVHVGLTAAPSEAGQAATR